jgi:hypothetical protein
MSFDPNAVSLKRAYDKNLITEVLPDDTILVFRGDNETNYHAYRLQYNQLLTLVGANSLFMGLFPTFNDLDAITGVSGNLAIVYDDVVAPVLYTWNATDSIWVELTSGSSIDHFKGLFTDFDTLTVNVEDGNLGDYAYVQNPTITRYDSTGVGGWFIPRTTNSYLGDFLDTNELPDGTGIVLNNDFATITEPYRPAVLYIASNDGNNVTWSKIGVANTDDLPESESPTNLYFTPERVRHSFPRSNIYFTKPELSGGEQFIGASTIFDQFKIFYFSTSVPCRFRLYVDSSLRDSDLTRDGVTPPTGNHGCIFDSSLNVANDVDCYVTPVILAMSNNLGSNEFFYTIDTLGGGDIEVTVTLSIVVESNIDYEPA